MATTSPIVDCGVHYVDVMLHITDALPVEVRGMGLRLAPEAGWGPMMSNAAFFVKEVVSPNGAVSIRMPETARSDDIDTHTRTSTLGLHRVGQPDQDEPSHQQLCDREAAYVAEAIAEVLDLTRHLQDAVQSLRVCLAADESVRSGHPVKL